MTGRRRAPKAAADEVQEQPRGGADALPEHAAGEPGGDPFAGLDPDADPFALFDEPSPVMAAADADEDHYPGLEVSHDDPFADMADADPAASEVPADALADDAALPSLDELAAVQLDEIETDAGALAALPSFDDAPEEDLAAAVGDPDFGDGLDLSPDDDAAQESPMSLDGFGGDDMAGLPALAGSATMLDTVDELPAPLYPRFLFETSFDILPAHLRVELEPVDPEPETPPAPLFDASELATARAVARAEGEAAGYAAAVRSAEAQTSRLMEAALAQLPGLLVDRDAAAASLTKEAARLAHAMVAKMLPEISRRYGLAEIEAVVVGSLEKAVDSPRILFRLSPANVELMRPRIDEMAALAGFAGRLMVSADPTLGDSDVRADWGDGGAERLAARAWSEISAIVTRAIEALDKTVAPAGTVMGWGREDAGSEQDELAP